MEEQNVVLREKMHLFFDALSQSRADGSISEEERQELQKKEAVMLSEVLKGNYLVPARTYPDRPTEFGILTTNEPKAEWLAAFTNMQELQKLFDPNQWTIFSLTYDDVIKEAGSRCAVIDPAGYNVRITEQNKAMIESFRENLVEQEADEPVQVESSAIQEENDTGFWAPIDENAHFTPANCPQPILSALSATMAQIPEVRRAYMVCMQTGGKMCFLAVVDTLGDQEAILEAIYKSAVPYLNGMELKMHGSDMWGLSAVNGIKPFYKKSFLK